MSFDGPTITLILAGLAGFAWLIRVESATKDHAREIGELKSHATNHAIHHNPQAFAEFEKRIDEKFAVFKESLEKVEGYVEDIDSKLDEVLKGQ